MICLSAQGAFKQSSQLPVGAVIDCTVRNIPRTGAALEVESPVGIPHKFFLVIETGSCPTGLPCRLRKERRIGVGFECV